MNGFGVPGVALSNNNRLMRMLQQQEAEAPPIQSHAQGLASVLRQGLAGYFGGQDRREREAAQRTYTDALASGGQDAAITAMQGMEGNFYADQMLPGMIAAQQNRQREAALREQQRRNEIEDARREFERDMLLQQAGAALSVDRQVQNLIAQNRLAAERDLQGRYMDYAQEQNKYNLPVMPQDQWASGFGASPMQPPIPSLPSPTGGTLRPPTQAMPQPTPQPVDQGAPQPAPQPQPQPMAAAPQESVQLPFSNPTTPEQVRSNTRVQEAAALKKAIPSKPNSSQTKVYNDSVSKLTAGFDTAKLLQDALNMNPKAVAGFGADAKLMFMRAADASGLVDFDDEIKASLGFQKIMLEQALNSLKATFGAAPTDGERKMLVDIQSALDDPREMRAERIQNALKLVRERQKREMRQIDLYENNFGNFSLGYSGTEIPDYVGAGDASPNGLPIGSIGRPMADNDGWEVVQ